MKLILALIAAMAVYSPVFADEPSLDKEQKHIEESLAPKPDAEKSERLANQYKVEKATVDDLRTKNRGWGEIGIELTMAQKLMEKDPKTYPTMGDALSKVDGMRNDGRGWGNIAKELDMKVGPIVSEARHARNELRAERRQEKLEKQQEYKVERQEERHEHRMKMERMRSDRMERMDRREKPAHPEHPEKPGKP